MLISCIIDKRFPIVNQQTGGACFLNIYNIPSQLIFLNVSLHKGLSTGNQTDVIQLYSSWFIPDVVQKRQIVEMQAFLCAVVVRKNVMDIDTQYLGSSLRT